MYFIDNFSQEGTGPNQPKRCYTSQRLAAQWEISQPVFPEREVVPQTKPTTPKCTGTKHIMQPKIKVTRLEDIVSDDAPG